MFRETLPQKLIKKKTKDLDLETLLTPLLFSPVLPNPDSLRKPKSNIPTDLLAIRMEVARCDHDNHPKVQDGTGRLSSF